MNTQLSKCAGTNPSWAHRRHPGVPILFGHRCDGWLTTRLRRSASSPRLSTHSMCDRCSL